MRILNVWRESEGKNPIDIGNDRASMIAKEPQSATEPEADHIPQRFPVYIINLERDVARRDAILGQFADLPEFEPKLVPAVYGPALADSVVEALIDNPDQPRWVARKGTLGCHLSHVAAWESIAKLGTPAVVIEDDVRVDGLASLSDAPIPADAEVVYLNGHMAPPHGTAAILPIWRALEFLDTMHTGSGAYGYLLTPVGAQKLVTACRRDLFFGHVDGRLLRYAADEADLAHLPDDSWIANVIRNHFNKRRVPALGLLRGYCRTPAVVHHIGNASVRDELDRPVDGC